MTDTPRPTPLFAILLATLMAGCVALPADPPALPATAPHWSAAPEYQAIHQPWLADFGSSALTALVEEAMAHNHDLRSAAARVEAAWAEARNAGAERLPTAEAALEAGRGNGSNPGGGASDSFDLGASVSWEADLWGRLADAERAAVADAAAVEADYRAARLSLAASVANGWFAVLEAEQQLGLARRTRESFGRSLSVIEERYRLGLSDALDLRLARTDVAAADSALAARERERDAALRTLEVLLGRYPAGELKTEPLLPELQGTVPAGLPAELLARRPDLVAAERRLEAAGAELETARKNRLPAIELTVAGGVTSSALGNLLSWDRLIWTLAGSLTLPLFQGGQLQAERDLARAGQREAWSDYAQAVLTAFQEVETALAAETRYTRQVLALRRAATEAREAETLAVQRYRQGLTDIITLLESQRRAFTAESTLLRTTRERLDNRVALYLALGGDFAGPSQPGTEP